MRGDSLRDECVNVGRYVSTGWGGTGFCENGENERDYDQSLRGVAVSISVLARRVSSLWVRGHVMEQCLLYTLHGVLRFLKGCSRYSSRGNT